jgi:hypothetical protein
VARSERAQPRTFEKWNDGPLASFTELTVCRRDAESKQPLVDVVLDKAGRRGRNGPRRSADLAVAIPRLPRRLTRVLSSLKDERAASRCSGLCRIASPEDIHGHRRSARRALRSADMRIRAGMAHIRTGSDKPAGTSISPRLGGSGREAVSGSPIGPPRSGPHRIWVTCCRSVDQGSTRRRPDGDGWSRARSTLASPCWRIPRRYFDSCPHVELPQAASPARGAHTYGHDLPGRCTRVVGFRLLVRRGKDPARQAESEIRGPANHEARGAPR